MKRRPWRVVALAISTALAGCGDSPTAPNPSPPAPTSPSGVEFETVPSIESDHRTVLVRFTNRGITLSGSLYLPPETGLYPGAVWVHGSGRASRLPFVNLWVREFVSRGIAVLSYDKRGVGASGGNCCPLDFSLLADDAVAAVSAMQSHSEIAPERVGLTGASQAGWIVPIAAAETPDVGFVVLQSGPTVSFGEENFFSRLTKDFDCGLDGIPPEEAEALTREQGPSGFDPMPFLQQMSQPGLWLYGLKDIQQPSQLSIERLRRLKQSGKPFTWIAFPEANHFLALGGPCEGVPRVEFVTRMFDWLLPRVGR